MRKEAATPRGTPITGPMNPKKNRCRNSRVRLTPREKMLRGRPGAEKEAKEEQGRHNPHNGWPQSQRRLAVLGEQVIYSPGCQHRIGVRPEDGKERDWEKKEEEEDAGRGKEPELPQQGAAGVGGNPLVRRGR